jgi:hypothetical protein
LWLRNSKYNMNIKMNTSSGNYEGYLVIQWVLSSDLLSSVLITAFKRVLFFQPIIQTLQTLHICLNSDGQQFHQYQQNEQPLLSSNYWTQEKIMTMTLEIHDLAWCHLFLERAPRIHLLGMCLAPQWVVPCHASPVCWPIWDIM